MDMEELREWFDELKETMADIPPKKKLQSMRQVFSWEKGKLNRSSRQIPNELDTVSQLMERTSP